MLRLQIYFHPPARGSKRRQAAKGCDDLHVGNLHAQPCWIVPLCLQIEAIEREALAAGDLRRGPAVRHWAPPLTSANPDAAALKDLYQVDLRGDRNNVVYDGLYQMDVASYRRTDPAGVAAGARPRQGPVYGR